MPVPTAAEQCRGCCSRHGSLCSAGLSSQQPFYRSAVRLPRLPPGAGGRPAESGSEPAGRSPLSPRGAGRGSRITSRRRSRFCPFSLEGGQPDHRSGAAVAGAASVCPRGGPVPSPGCRVRVRAAVPGEPRCSPGRGYRGIREEGGIGEGTGGYRDTGDTGRGVPGRGPGGYRGVPQEYRREWRRVPGAAYRGWYRGDTGGYRGSTEGDTGELWRAYRVIKISGDIWGWEVLGGDIWGHRRVDIGGYRWEKWLAGDVGGYRWEIAEGTVGSEGSRGKIPGEGDIGGGPVGRYRGEIRGRDSGGRGGRYRGRDIGGLPWGSQGEIPGGSRGVP